jgi:undecaprenyl diphosphate synthase
LQLNIAVNYGGRTELVDACRRVAEEVAAGRLRPEEINEQVIESKLYTSALPDPDLLIRTSGETRISNFLLWQIAYSEIYITPTMWPDFDERAFLTSLIEYQKRDRRYGGVRESNSTLRAASAGD